MIHEQVLIIAIFNTEDYFMSSNCKHEEKTCPRCGKNFECKVGDIVHCQCHGINFTKDATAFIGKNYDDCLCRECLLALNELMVDHE